MNISAKAFALVGFVGKLLALLCLGGCVPAVASPSQFSVTVEQGALPFDVIVAPSKAAPAIPSKRVVMITAGWCVPCLAWHNGGVPPWLRKAGWTIGPDETNNLQEIDYDKPCKYKVDNLPTFFLLENEKIIGRYEGAPTLEQFRKWYEKGGNKTQAMASAYPVRGNFWTGPGGDHPFYTKVEGIEHMLEPPHRGKFSLRELYHMTLAQLNSAHSNHHDSMEGRQVKQYAMAAPAAPRRQRMQRSFCPSGGCP